MATEYIGLPGQLVDKVKEAAAKEEISPEEFVRGAVRLASIAGNGGRQSNSGTVMPRSARSSRKT